MLYYDILTTEFCEWDLFLACDEHTVVRLERLTGNNSSEKDAAAVKIAETIGAEKEKTSVILKAEQELKEYFSGNRREFSVSVHPTGTEFQRNVWHALCDIPYGETRSYKDIAAAIGNPRACRAVGMANHHNPIMIFIPCHRVIGADGSLTGYAGGLDGKEALLELERNHKV